MDILVAFVGGEHDETRLGGIPPYGANDIHTALIGKPEISESDVGPMFPEQTKRFVGSCRLGGYGHVRLRLNDGGNAEAHDRVIVADENFNLLFITHIGMVSSTGGDCRWERRTLKETAGPCSGSLTIRMRPPIRSTRSRMPSIPSCCAPSALL